MSRIITSILGGLTGLLVCQTFGSTTESIHELALLRQDDLRLSAYATASSVQELATNEVSREQALVTLRSLGITKVYLEVYRSGLVVKQSEMERVRDFFKLHSFGVTGGIATVPGRDFGVRANSGLTWFNWQSEKTQRDLEGVIRTAARVFDEFIVDDFLCTGDTSSESDAARGGRLWSLYRRDLLSELSQSVFIGPAKEVNPSITMIIKYPQWYDRFHLFGYDVERQPKLFDKVWVGTETRGARTQRFGFTQPYQGFVNYRWLSSLSGKKISGAWFDHGDCDAHDFVEQAWQTVLAGAHEIILFNYGNLVRGHPGHALLKNDFKRLADLAKAVHRNPVVGVGAYKPPHSDAGGDLYLMDFIGMLGIPLIPYSEFPEDSNVIFLPTQAAADPSIDRKMEAALSSGKDIVVTTGFLATAPNNTKLTDLAGLVHPIRSKPMKAAALLINEKTQTIEPALGLEADLTPDKAKVVLEALVQGRKVPVLLEHHVEGRRVAVLNTHTYSQADFNAVGEVLLPPRALGLTEIPSEWAMELRRVFGHAPGIKLRAPSRVTLQALQATGWFIQNYNNESVTVEIDFTEDSDGGYIDGFTHKSLTPTANILTAVLPSRSRLWVKPNGNTPLP